MKVILTSAGSSGKVQLFALFKHRADGQNSKFAIKRTFKRTNSFVSKKHISAQIEQRFSRDSSFFPDCKLISLMTGTFLNSTQKCERLRMLSDDE